MEKSHYGTRLQFAIIKSSYLPKNCCAFIGLALQYILG